ncbi:LuxR family transcriptional regulator [Dermatobacter hominis]|uniref:LuxR family transcriptional regulator n=1 Tax=Dermatobacter hominis TaxID=2884263 RepID=UPI001D105338|nr:LuxR family transcriptional regulator [Dermatobacter hominis]UDY37898.1 LuxR C-terminal-related transcriptional regulator [Dermatobacter hominis]
MDGGELLEAAEVALAEGDFDRAVASCEHATTFTDVEGPARALLGGLRFMDERWDDAQREWERSFRLLRQEGRSRRAARVACELAGLQVGVKGHPSVANGWRERARRCLEGDDRCVEHGYLELAVMACERLNTDELLASTERALAIAVESGDTTLEARALSDQGTALVTRGHVREGFDRLDAALAMITAGEVEPVSVGLCLCAMLTACDRAGEIARAEEATALVQAFYGAMAPRPVVMFTHCRVTYGSVLCASGRWPEGEAELLSALGPADDPVRSHRPQAIAHLADLRIDQGRIEDAAALLDPFGEHVTCSRPLARLHLARGDLDLAQATLRRGLGEMVGDALRRAPLLDLLAEMQLRAGDLEGAAATADELVALAGDVDLATVQTHADRTTARVRRAAGDRDGALDALNAVLSRHAGELTLTVALAHLHRAEIRTEAGDGPGSIDDGRTALAIGTRLGAAPVRDRAAALLRDLGDTGRVRPTSRDELSATLSAREQEVLGLIAEGLTNAQIAERLFISPKTAEHHVGRVLSKLGVRSRAEAAALAVRLAVTPGA